MGLVLHLAFPASTSLEHYCWDIRAIPWDLTFSLVNSERGKLRKRTSNTLFSFPNHFLRRCRSHHLWRQHGKMQHVQPPVPRDWVVVSYLTAPPPLPSPCWGGREVLGGRKVHKETPAGNRSWAAPTQSTNCHVNALAYSHFVSVSTTIIYYPVG